MLFRRYIPRSPLSDCVADLWLYEDYTGEHRFESILPSGTFEMVFNLQEDELRIYGVRERERCRRFAGAVISGPYAGPFVSDIAEEAAILGVHFRPGGAAAVLGLPAGQFADAHVELQAIWGPAATELHERLCALRTPSERFRLLEAALLRRLAEPPTRTGAVRAGLDLLLGSRGRARVSDVARAVDLSQRRFAELFVAEVGLAPKLFGRIARFQHVLASSRSEARVDWAGLAVDCGYFDQSHLIRDFAEFSGVSPADYLGRQIRLDRAGVHTKRNHLPLVD